MRDLESLCNRGNRRPQGFHIGNKRIWKHKFYNGHKFISNKEIKPISNTPSPLGSKSFKTDAFFVSIGNKFENDESLMSDFYEDTQS